MNPVKAGFAVKPEEYLYSIANFFFESKGLLNLESL
jgi:hypothetical protein